MHEDLLGYLLGALEPHEMRRVEALLRHDADAREELARIEQSLHPLDEMREPDEAPPPDLVARTLNSLPPLPASPESAGSRDLAEAASNAASGEPPAEMAKRRPALEPMREAVETAPDAPRRWFDWFGGAVAAAVLLGLLLPTLAEGRFEARRQICEDQLREFGTAITQFVMRDSDERLPAVARSGPEAFAGVFAVRLNDAGLLENPRIRWCPSLDRPHAARHIEPPAPRTSAGADGLVPAEELHRSPMDRLQVLQRTAGGHYAYTLGVVDKDRYAPPQYESRTSFAVLSDAPLDGYDSGSLAQARVGHGGRGINVLYEDGHVRFVPVDSIRAMPDHPLLNHRGNVEAGVNIDDAVLAPSDRAPFLDVHQR